MSRKDHIARKSQLKAMLLNIETPAQDAPPAPERAHTPPPPPLMPLSHVRAGAVGAMERSLSQVTQSAEAVRKLIATGTTIVELAPEDIDEGIIQDRLDLEGPGFDLFVEAIRTKGQQSPILVRPAPEPERAAGPRYEIVFGRRRRRAAIHLGRPVRAIVQNLTDEEVVVIQGQENSGRTDLTYIEKALYAAALEERSFDRSLIMAALSIEKTQLSRLLAVASAVPRHLAQRIGSAPGIGQPRWAKLAERLEADDAPTIIARVTQEASFKAAPSDARFKRLFRALAPVAEKPARPRPQRWSAPDGREIATFARADGKFSLTIDEKAAPDFGTFLTDRLPELLEAFERGRSNAPA